MNEQELEEIMYDMVNGDTDVLVCTTIIETGLDIPNANTIIIGSTTRRAAAFRMYELFTSSELMKVMPISPYFAIRISESGLALLGEVKRDEVVK